MLNLRMEKRNTFWINFSWTKSNSAHFSLSKPQTINSYNCITITVYFMRKNKNKRINQMLLSSSGIWFRNYHDLNWCCNHFGIATKIGEWMNLAHLKLHCVHKLFTSQNPYESFSMIESPGAIVIIVINIFPWKIFLHQMSVYVNAYAGLRMCGCVCVCVRVPSVLWMCVYVNVRVCVRVSECDIKLYNTVPLIPLQLLAELLSPCLVYTQYNPSFWQNVYVRIFGVKVYQLIDIALSD